MPPQMSESPGTLSQNRLNLWGAGHWALWALGFPWEIAPLMPEPRTPGAECPTQWGTGPAAQIDPVVRFYKGIQNNVSKVEIPK